MKKLIISTIFCFSVLSLQSESAWQKFLKELFGQGERYLSQTGDYEACGRLVDQEIEYLLQPGIQTEQVKNDINVFKDKTRQDIIFYLKHQKLPLTIEKGKSLSKEMARSKAIEYLQEKAVQITREKLNNPPINPSLFDKNKVVEAIKNDVQTLSIRLLEEKKRLVWILDALDETVQSRLSNYFNQLQYSSSTTHPSHSSAPSAASLEDDIKEIYPKLDGERNKTFFNEEAVKKRKNLRDEEQECPVCFERFADLKVRTNLFCGHFICPSCAYKILYNYDKAQCPLCRREIRKEEFPQNFLRQFYKP